MKTPYKLMLSISTAAEIIDDEMQLGIKFHLSNDFKNSSYQFQELMLKQVREAYNDMLSQVSTLARLEEMEDDEEEVIDLSDVLSDFRGKMH